MYTAQQAREDVNKYEAHVREETLENLLKHTHNSIALEIFEAEIESLASKGHTKLFINRYNYSELYDLIQETDIKTILKFLGYSIDSEYGTSYSIKW